MKSGELRLPYYKQGDDLSQILGDELDRDNLDPNELCVALDTHAEMLRASAYQLKMASKIIDAHCGAGNYHIQADTHTITLAGPDQPIEELLQAELLMPEPFEDEDEED
jgi:hypothetical protein